MASQTGTGATNKYALLIGIEYYARPFSEQTTPRCTGDDARISFKNLDGAVNDILAVREYLIKTMKVKKENIKMLLSPVPDRKYQFKLKKNWYDEPTYMNIVNSLESLAFKEPGDLVYIHYSGHGARTTTIFSTLKKDDNAEDHSLVPCDITQGGNYLRDLEIGALLQDIVEKKAILTVVLDCCHSGGAVRGEDDEEDDAEGIRGISGIYKSDPEKDHPKSSDQIEKWGNVASWMEIPKGFVVLAACLDHQKAKEMTAPDCPSLKHGRLTFWLLDTIRNNPLHLSSHAIYHRVCAKILDGVRDQTPYIIGDADRFFFNQKFRPQVHSLPVRRLELGNAIPMTRRTVDLGGGQLLGVKHHSVYAILPMEFDLQRQIEASDILALVQVKSVRTGESVTTFVEPTEISRWGEIREGCPAVLQRLPLKSLFTVQFCVSKNEHLEKFKQEWEKESKDSNTARLRLTEKGDAYFKVTLDHKNNFQIEDQPGNFASYIAATLDAIPCDESDSMPKLIRRLDHLARFKLIKELQNPGAREDDLCGLVSVNIEPAEEGQYFYDEWYPAAEEIKDKNGVYNVDENAWFQFVIKNNTTKHVGCVILNCMPEFGIDILYPYESHAPYISLAPEKEEHAYFFVRIPETLRANAEAVASMVDTFKVFISVPERHLDSLRLPKLRYMEDASRADDTEVEQQVASDDTLDDLLEELAPLARDGYGSSGKKNRGDWEAMDFRIRALPSSSGF
jgi:hypothetical protein